VTLGNKILPNVQRNRNESSKTDWNRIDAMHEEAIGTSDIPPRLKAFFDNAALHTPLTRIIHE